jgi:hypothetical protein
VPALCVAERNKENTEIVVVAYPYPPFSKSWCEEYDTERSIHERMSILDRFKIVAMVKGIVSGWVDYLQEAKFNGEWKIVNVLWELKPTMAENK